jgi:hypothetical protein
VRPGAIGTAPIQVVEYAEQLFRNGDREKGIEPRTFDRVFAVFDRDDHGSYHAALGRADALDGKLRNDTGCRVSFRAIASVPCFEVWLLLHFEDVLAPVSRDEVYKRLKVHMQGYEKGQQGHWAATKDWFDVAAQRAQARAVATTAYDGNETYTAMHELVELLMHLQD